MDFSQGGPGPASAATHGVDSSVQCGAHACTAEFQLFGHLRQGARLTFRPVSPAALLTSTAATLAALLALALANSRLRAPAAGWLAAALACLTVAALNAAGHSLGWSHPAYVVSGDIVWPSLIPALFLGYFAHLLDDRLAHHPARHAWAVPFCLTALVNLYIDGSADLGLYQLPSSLNGQMIAAYYTVESVGTIMFAFAAAAYSRRIIERHRQHPAHAWASWMWRGYLAVLLTWAVSYAASEWLAVELMAVVWTAILLFICGVVYEGVLAARLRHHTPRSRERTAVPDPHLRRFDECLASKRRYSDANLSRGDIAREIGISASHLGRLLSRAGRPPFTQLVAAYRVEEVKWRLHDPASAHLSLVAIAEECGFRSKSAFNRTFKRVTGLTPSAYRERTQAE